MDLRHESKDDSMDFPWMLDQPKEMEIFWRCDLAICISVPFSRFRVLLFFFFLSSCAEYRTGFVASVAFSDLVQRCFTFRFIPFALSTFVCTSLGLVARLLVFLKPFWLYTFCLTRVAQRFKLTEKNQLDSFTVISVSLFNIISSQTGC